MGMLRPVMIDEHCPVVIAPACVVIAAFVFDPQALVNYPVVVGVLVVVVVVVVDFVVVVVVVCYLC